MKKVGLLEHIFTILSREINTDRLHELEIKTAQLKKEIKSLKKKMFLTKGDFSFIKSNLLTEDLFVIEEYLKKYSEFAL